MRDYVRWQNSLVTDKDMRDSRFIESPVTHPSVMVRREVFERHGGYRKGDFPEDYELWLRLMEAGVVFGKLDRTLLYWRNSQTRLTRTDERYRKRAFYETSASYLSRWLARHVEGGRPLYFWGAGRESLRRSDFLLREGHEPEAYIDIDPRKIGRMRRERPVVSPAEIALERRPFVIPFVGGRGVREEIARTLAGMGLKAGRDFLFAA